MRVKIGDSEVFQTVSLLLLDGKIAEFDLDNAGSRLTAEVLVQNDGGSQTLEVTGKKPGTVTITFRNWDNPLGYALNQEQRFGTTADNKFQLLLLAAVWRVGSLNRIEMQFMLRPNS